MVTDYSPSPCGLIRCCICDYTGSVCSLLPWRHYKMLDEVLDFTYREGLVCNIRPPPPPHLLYKDPTSP
ncbi:hypothetical protein GDO81_025707 [Engystomops pustulosus]|uniref:Uncharacterized protein n=1 Tax=Engystomops pustulosus TaxID=76066 RepID=A0AAV6YHW8_ENGPU|nr:hypothetical protein GDO81_025707 [Engystomops pustulosus]